MHIVAPIACKNKIYNIVIRICENTFLHQVIVSIQDTHCAEGIHQVLFHIVTLLKAFKDMISEQITQTQFKAYYVQEEVCSS